MLTPDLPPRIGPAAEIHQPSPAQDPKPLWDFILDWPVERRSSLVSVLDTYSGSTAASVLAEGIPPEDEASGVAEDDSVLDQAVKVVTELLERVPERKAKRG